MPIARRVTDLAPLDQVVLAARPLIVDRVTAPRRDAAGVERVVVCGICSVTGRNVAVITPTDTAAALCS